MLRTLISDEPELVRSCRNRNWVSVWMRSKSHPFEARPSDLALQGEGTTALGIAVRSGAPRETIEAVAEASIGQVGIVNKMRGNILIEALRHRASDEVLDYLLKAIVEYQSTCPNHQDILGTTDDLGRTALHCIVENIKQALKRGQRNPFNWVLFRDLLFARPDSVRVMDGDGNTPLILLLLLHRVQDEDMYFVIEQEVFGMVQLMVSTCPYVAAISCSLPKPWQNLRYIDCGGIDGAPTALYYAVLHGRSVDTVQILIEANRKIGVNACSTIISHYHEIPLHIAISTQTSVAVISKLVEACPESVLSSDVYGLTPVDWMWIRHVVDWYTENSPRSLVSRGRFLAGRFLDWHEDVSRRLPDAGVVHFPSISSNTCDQSLPKINRIPRPLRRVTEDLLARMRVVLPVVAAAATPSTVCESWSLLHAACYVPCPLAMVHLAIEHSESYELQRPDSLAQRLPLHYAAGRLGYAASFPVGVSRNLKRLTEKTAVPALVGLYSQACTIYDGHGRLPIHIAIDAARHYRELSASSSVAMRLESAEVDEMESEMLDVLVSSYQDSLECRDGKTNLLPFQQAAVGRGARVNTIYSLLRQLPSLVAPVFQPYHIDIMDI
jgi:hypothetical protein